MVMLKALGIRRKLAILTVIAKINDQMLGPAGRTAVFLYNGSTCAWT
jgi:hypothetical protein